MRMMSLTLFPGMFPGVLDSSIRARAPTAIVCLSRP